VALALALALPGVPVIVEAGDGEGSPLRAQSA